MRPKLMRNRSLTVAARHAVALLLAALPLWAALPATGVIELRASATAGNVNGCGFNSARGGTDYTLQDAAQATNTNLSTSGAGATTITSASAPFTSAMVGNYVHITAGTNFQAGWYEITTFTDTSNVVVDRTPSSGAAGSSGTFYVGGACSLNSSLDDDLFEIGVAGNIFYIKNGSYTLGEAVSVAAAGGAQQPIVVMGYNSTRGDNPRGSTRPTISQGANAFTLAANWNWGYIVSTGTAATMFTAGAANQVQFSKFTNTSTTTGRVALALGNADVLVYGVEAVSYRGIAITSSQLSQLIMASYLHDSDVCFRSTTTGVPVLLNNIMAGCYTTGISNTSSAWTAGGTVVNNTLVGRAGATYGGTALSFLTGATDIRLMNNIIYGWTTGITHPDTQTIGFDNYNFLFHNTTNTSNWTLGGNSSTSTDPQLTGIAELSGATATTSGSVLTQSGGDFSTVTDNVDFLYLVSGTGVTVGYYLITSHTATTVTLDIAPGTNATADKVWFIRTGNNFVVGSNMAAVGYPGAFPASLTTGYLDAGAVQRQCTGSGGQKACVIQ